MITKNLKFRKKGNRLLEGAVATAAFFIVFLGIVGFFVYQNVSMAQKRSALEDRFLELQAQVQELSLQKEILEADVANTQTEEYQERMLREQGLYKKEGEQVVTILPPEIGSEEISDGEGEKKRVWWNPFTW